MPASVADSIIVFAISLLVGSIGILVGARLVVDEDASWPKAVVVALVGAVVWAVLSFFVGWIPILGPLALLVVWVGTINLSYPGGWGSAAAIGFVAWIVAAAILVGLGILGVITPEALGIPGV